VQDAEASRSLRSRDGVQTGGTCSDKQGVWRGEGAPERGEKVGADAAPGERRGLGRQARETGLEEGTLEASGEAGLLREGRGCPGA
jgi:hypothetical protein